MGRFRHTATLLREGDLDEARRIAVVIGGCNAASGTAGCETATSEFFLQDSAAWVPGPDLLGARFGHVSVRLRAVSYTHLTLPTN